MAKHPHLFEKEIKGLSPGRDSLTGDSNAIAAAITGISSDFPHTNPRNAYLYEKLLKAYTKTLVNSTDFKFGDPTEHQNFFPGQFTSRSGPSPRQLAIVGASGGLNGLYEKKGSSYQQIGGSGYSLGRVDLPVGTEEDSSLIQYNWAIEELTSSSTVFSTHTRIRNDSNPKILQPYEIGANSPVIIAETGITRLSPTFFTPDTGNSFFDADVNIQL